MRLPIYRRLDEGLKIFGLTLKELVFLGVIFVGVGQLLSFWRWGRVVGLGLTLLGVVGIRILNAKVESFYLQKTLRFLNLPSKLQREIFSFKKESL